MHERGDPCRLRARGAIMEVNIYRRALRGERLTLLFGFEMKPAPQKLVADAALEPPLDTMRIIL